MKNILAVFVVLIVLLGIAVRSVEVLNGNYVFGFDQGFDYLSARNIAVNHKFTLIGAEAGAGFAGLPGVFHGPGYHYMLAALVLLFSGNPYGSIISLFILSVAVLWCLYVLARKVFGTITATVVLVFAALSPTLAAQARMQWAPNFSGVIAIPYLFAIYDARKKTPCSGFITMLLAAMLYHFELPMAVPAVLAAVGYFWFVLRIRSLKTWGASVMGLIFGFSPMLLFESRHGWKIIRGIGTYIARTNTASVSAPFRPLVEFIGDMQSLFTTIRDSFMVPAVSQYVPIVLLIGSVYFVLREKQLHIRHFVWGLLLIIGAHIAVYYPYRGPAYPHYFSFLYFIYPLLAGYVVGKSLKMRWIRWIALGFLVVIVSTAAVRYPVVIRKDLVDSGGTAKVSGKVEAIDFIFKDASGSPFGLLVFTPPVYPYAYEYLVRWYGQRTYGYIPAFSAQKITYLLIEPDPGIPWSYKGWLETVIKSGTVLNTWTLPSGFIIEKRSME